MIPTLPFIYLIFSIVLLSLFEKYRRSNFSKALYIGGIMLISICCLYAFTYFITVTVKSDTRIEAKQWIETHMIKGKSVISETYDPGSLAFYGVFEKQTFCDFYELENISHICEGSPLEEVLKETQYIFIPSNRIMQSRLLNQNRFPKGHSFYNTLFKNNRIYVLSYTTPCDLFCTILYMGNQQQLEQTAYVFDRPTVYVIEKK
jgi:hypothetical protein